jgi:hypothetical protein
MGVAQGAELALFSGQHGGGLLGAVREPVELNMVTLETGAARQEYQYRNGRNRKKSRSEQSLISHQPTV